MDIPQIKDKNRISLEETREMQRIILGILEAIDKVCRKHNLQYFMIAGTMLGAVRHHGFIPWDDDADVALPRHDYEVLLAHANEWLPEEYELQFFRWHSRRRVPYRRNNREPTCS